MGTRMGTEVRVRWKRRKTVEMSIVGRSENHFGRLAGLGDAGEGG